MNDPDDLQDAETHAVAATTFVQQVETRDMQGLNSLILFGSTARGDASGLESDVDFLAVVADDVDMSAIEDQLRDVAYDVMLEYGPVVEVHVVTQSTLEQRRGHPFLNRALCDGEAYV